MHFRTFERSFAADAPPSLTFDSSMVIAIVLPSSIWKKERFHAQFAEQQWAMNFLAAAIAYEPWRNRPAEFIQILDRFCDLWIEFGVIRVGLVNFYGQHFYTPRA